MTTPAYMLHRHCAGDTSVAAAYAVDTDSAEDRVLRAIRAAGAPGTTQDALLDALPGMRYPTLTARFSALLRRARYSSTVTRTRFPSSR